MPIIYLSPSTQENNYYVNGGTEEQYMNLLADKMVPYLNASGIRYTRNTPGPLPFQRGRPFFFRTRTTAATAAITATTRTGTRL